MITIPESDMRLIDAGALNISGAKRETDLSISAVAAVSGQITRTATSNLSKDGLRRGGVFDLLATVDCYVEIGINPSTVTTTTGYPLLAGNVVAFYVPEGHKVAAITSGATGTLMMHRSK